MNGFGTFNYYNGAKYEGNFENSLRSGKGKYTYINNSKLLKYDGDWKEDKITGVGELTYKNGDKYIGEFKDFK
jgi:hypothetical protein